MAKHYPKSWLIVHHSASPPSTTFEQINSWHKARSFPKSSMGYYVGYQYVILSDGEVRQARHDLEEGAHTIPQNKNFNGIGICLTGNFTVEQPTDAQEKSLGELLGRLMEEQNISLDHVQRHKDFAKTACPGNLSNEYIHGLINQGSKFMYSPGVTVEFIKVQDMYHVPSTEGNQVVRTFGLKDRAEVEADKHGEFVTDDGHWHRLFAAGEFRGWAPTDSIIAVYNPYWEEESLRLEKELSECEAGDGGDSKDAELGRMFREVHEKADQ